ncbi:hypothetical protein [Acetobacteroides hydrogenigenes]|nr:hypothetical protein [Acetobacteroides hydrogenigenes]
MKLFKSIILAVGMLSVFPFAQAQDSPAQGSLDMHLQVKNMHLWRGYAVTEAPMTGLNVAYINPSKTFKVGVWGGAGFNGDYREFDYYVAYNKGGFKFEVWDIFNFSPGMPTKLFDYDQKTTSHFIDVTLGYQFGKSFPLYLSASTIVYGRDLESIPSSLPGVGPRLGDNRYSTYVHAEYPVCNYNGYDLKLYLGGAFALAGQTQNFYASKSNIVATGFVVSKSLTIGSYTIPVSATALWNPELNSGNIQLAVDLF